MKSSPPNPPGDAWFDAAPAAMVVASAEVRPPGPRLRRVNPAFAARLGLPADEVEGARVGEVLTGPQTDAAALRQAARRIRAGRSWHGRVRLHGRDGPLDTCWRIAPIADTGGGEPGLIAVETESWTADAQTAAGERDRALFDNAPFGIYLTTVDGRFVRVNPRMAHLYGCDDPDDFLATFSNTDATFRRPGEPYIPAYMEKASRRALQREMAEHGRVEGFECRARRKDGTPFWTQEDARPLRDAEGRIVGYEGFIQNIGARKDSEARVAEANQRMRQVADIAGVGGWEHHPATGELIWDAEVRRIHEVAATYAPTLEDALGFYPADTRAELRAALTRTIERHEGWDKQLPLQTARGRWVWVRAVAQPILAQGRVAKVVGVVQDVTAWKLTQQKLAENAALLEMAGRVARFGGWAADLHQGVVHWSDVVADIHEMPRGRTIGLEASYAFVTEDHRDAARRAFEACVKEGTPYDRERQAITATGKPVWVREVAEAVRDAEGRIVRVQGALQDITDRKHHEAELRRARDEARAADTAKTQFLANISHELRTPLNAIIGFSDLIREQVFGDDTDTYARHAGDIHESGQHLLELVNDLLDMARLDQRAYRMDEERLYLGEIAQAAGRVVRKMAADKGVAVSVPGRGELSVVRGDQRAIRQVLINLLTNAVKFTPAGGEVRLWGTSDADEVVLAVTDTGVGIAPEDIERVLRPFERADERHARQRQSGTGLGLGISRGLMELHGGGLTIESTPGAGTTVRAHFPASRVLDDAPAAASGGAAAASR